MCNKSVKLTRNALWNAHGHPVGNTKPHLCCRHTLGGRPHTRTLAFNAQSSLGAQRHGTCTARHVAVTQTFADD